MSFVTKRDLNQHTASVLGRVTASEDIIVTERGKPRWRVSAFRETDTALARLERDGRYTPPAVHPTPWPNEPGGQAYSDAEVEALLAETRGEI